MKFFSVYLPALLVTIVLGVARVDAQTIRASHTITSDNAAYYTQPRRTLRYVCHYVDGKVLIGRINTSRIVIGKTKWTVLKSKQKVPSSIKSACKKFDPVDQPDPSPTPSATPTVTGTPTPNPTYVPTSCSELSGLAGDKEKQVTLLKALPLCSSTFVNLLKDNPASYLDALYELIPDHTLTDFLFSSIYNFVYAGTLKFSKEVIDSMSEQLPAAVAKCTGHSRCADWNTAVLRLFLIGTFFSCPSTSGLSEQELLNLLKYGDYYCTDSVASALAGGASTATIDSLLTILSNGSLGWQRRNAARILIRFWEQTSTSTAFTLVSSTKNADIRAILTSRLALDQNEDALHDIIYLLDAKYFPYLTIESDLQTILASTSYSSSLRFRAASAFTRLISSTAANAGSFSSAEIDFLEAQLSSDDEYVRAQMAFGISTISPISALSAGQQTQLTNALQSRWSIEEKLSAKVYVALALDYLTGSTLHAGLKTNYEAQYLSNQVQGSGITIRSSLSTSSLNSYLTMLINERNAYFNILGAPFNTPLTGDPTASVTLYLFESPGIYQEYMSSFGPCCANAGGVYIESTAIFYTYDRTAQQSSYTTEQLVKHEFGHHLNGRYVLPGIYGDSGYFDQPKMWFDEGFSEVLAGLSFAGDGTYTLHPHNVEEGTVCAASSKPNLNAIISETSYSNTTYPYGWALSYYLTTESHSSFLGILNAYRDNSYNLTNFTTHASVPSLSSMETDFHRAIDEWCADSSLSMRALFDAQAKPEFPHFERPTESFRSEVLPPISPDGRRGFVLTARKLDELK